MNWPNPMTASARATLRTFVPIYFSNFFLAMHVFLVVYVISNFLSTFIDDELIGFVYAGGSILSVVGFIAISKALAQFRIYRTLLVLTIVEFVLFMSIAHLGGGSITLFLLMAHLLIYPLIIYLLDIFLENYTKSEKTTGGIRGLFLTTTNLALIISPLLAGFIVGADNYNRIFFVSAIFLIPFFLIIALRERAFHDPRYIPFSARVIVRHVIQNAKLKIVFKAHFVMQLFFAWMTIYIPLYLHQHLGFPWEEIGPLFAIMLLPYLLIELPAGRLADSRFGEKELMTAGFVIVGLSLAAMSFITTSSFIVWALVLFLTRVGAALLESMTETYFFKHVDGDDAGTISAFRMLRPLSYLLGPVIASLALFFIDIQYIFLIFGLIVLLGIRYSLTLHDTR